MNLLRPALALALSAAALSAQAADHVYTLDGTLADQNGTSLLVADGGMLDATGYSFGVNQGLSLSNVLGSVYTIDFQSSFTDVNGYRKLVDFRDLASDSGFYDLSTMLNFYDGGDVANGTPGTFVPNMLARITLTRDAAGTFTGYVNGLQQIQFDDSVRKAATFTTAGTQIARFFEDDAATGNRESSAGRVEYIRTFDSALSAADVAALAPVPEPQTYALMLAGLLLTAGVARARKR